MSEKDLGRYAVIALWFIAGAITLIGFFWGMFGEATGTSSLLLTSGIGVFFLLGLHNWLFPEPTIANLLIFILGGVVIVCLLNILDAQGRRVDVTLEYYGILLLLPIGALIFYEYRTDIMSNFHRTGLTLNNNLSFLGYYNSTALCININDNKGKYLVVTINGQKVILEKLDSEYVSRALFIEAIHQKGIVCLNYDRLKKQLTLIIRDSTGSVLDIVDCAIEE